VDGKMKKGAKWFPGDRRSIADRNVRHAIHEEQLENGMMLWKTHRKMYVGHIENCARVVYAMVDLGVTYTAELAERDAHKQHFSRWELVRTF
jgi:hypothetical protein